MLGYCDVYDFSGKRQHATLTQEGQQLQSAIRSKEGEIKSSQETLRGDKEKYQKLREKLEKDIHLYEVWLNKQAHVFPHPLRLFLELYAPHPLWYLRAHFTAIRKPEFLFGWPKPSKFLNAAFVPSRRRSAS